MCRSLSQDPRLRSAKLADIVVRKDGREVRIEADWLKTLCKIVEVDLTPPVPQPGEKVAKQLQKAADSLKAYVENKKI